MKKATEALKADKVIVVDELVHDGAYQITTIADIRPSPDNRKRFNELALTELSASIKAMGVAQPILIRPVTPTVEQPEPYEIVAGERRYRASKLAGILTIPTMVRTLTDLQAAKIRILENLQREDPHPMEEAQGYALLMQQHGYDADQLAEEIKKSRSYVYGRLKLCALNNNVQEQFFDNSISASVALLIARIPTPVLQNKALAEILKPSGYPIEPMSYRRAAEHVQSRYMLDLSTAIFPTADGKLLAVAGSCVKCPKRTGNQPEVFTDVKGADVCTDPDCFSEKKAAHHNRTLEQAKKKGIPVLEGEEVADIQRNRWDRTAEFVTGTEGLFYFDRNAPSTKNQGSPIELLPKNSVPEPVSYLKSGDGTMTAVYDRKQIQAALEKSGFCETVEEHAARMATPKASDAASKVKQAESERLQVARQDRAEKETAYRLALYRKLRQRGATGFGLASLREFAKLIVRDDNTYSVPDDLIGDVYPFSRATDDAVCEYIDQASLPEVQMIIVDMALSDCLQVEANEVDDLENAWGADTFATLESMAVHEGISPHMLKLEMRMASVDLADIGDGELADFIRFNPSRIEELKEYILEDRPYCLTLLEAAALVNGLEYWQGTFIPIAGKAEAATAVTTEAVPPAASEDQVATLAAPAQIEDSTDEGDADQLTAQMADVESAPKAKVKPSKAKSIKLAPAAAAWPWPTRADEVRRDEKSTDVAAAPADNEVAA